jgi:hypothetical protein
MTCRIERVLNENNLVVLSVSGQITGNDVDLLRNLLEEERDAVALDLRNVLLVDRVAIKLLGLGEAKGIELRNCPAYIREWVTREKANLTAPEEKAGGKDREDIDDD